MTNLATKFDAEAMYNSNTFSSVHVVSHLSKRQAARLAHNSIHITQSSITEKCVYYNNIAIGKGVCSNKKKIRTSKGYMWSDIVNIGNMKQNLLAIATSFNEINDDIAKSKILILDATNRTTTNNYNDDKYEPSGVILLALIHLDVKYEGILEWKKEHHNMMHEHKKPLFETDSKHHGSTGKYYSYGNKGNFWMVGLSSIGQYTSRECDLQSHIAGKCIEELSQMEM